MAARPFSEMTGNAKIVAMTTIGVDGHAPILLIATETEIFQVKPGSEYTKLEMVRFEDSER